MKATNISDWDGENPYQLFPKLQLYDHKKDDERESRMFELALAELESKNSALGKGDDKTPNPSKSQHSAKQHLN